MTLIDDGRRLEGISYFDTADQQQFPDGTSVWIIFSREDSYDLLRIRYFSLAVEGIPLSSLNNISSVFKVGASSTENLLPIDPNRVNWQEVDGKRGRTLRVMLEQDVAVSVGSGVMAVNVAYGDSGENIDTGMPFFEFVDPKAPATSIYKIVAVRRVQLGKSNRSIVLIRS